MTNYRVGLTKREGAVDGWVFELPGCRAVGMTVAETVELLPVVIAEHLTWLKLHGETQVSEGFDFEVVEEVANNGEFCFEADSEPLTLNEIETATRRMGYSLDDITVIAEPLSPVVLEWRPPASSVRADERVPDARTIREMLEHAAGAEGYFLRNIVEPQPDQPTAPGTDFRRIREATLSHFGSLNLAESARVYKRQGPRGVAEWSARKVLRRIINHQRFHTREVEQRLCWLALGVPEVIPASRE
jgi:hypothetical protein